MGMKTLHWNGENWYVNERSILHRVRRWFVWFGGWERSRGGWQFRIPSAGRKWIWLTPWPLSFLGHRLTLFGHWFDVRLPSGNVLVVNFREKYAYVSRDGTPNRAHCWLWGLHAKNWNLPDEARQLVLTPEQRADIA